MTNDDLLREAISAATDIACANQRGLATSVGVSAVTLSYWRTGRRHPSPRNAMELGRVLLDQARCLERAAHEVLRLAQEEDLRQEGPTGTDSDSETLELFGEKDAGE